MSYLDKFILKNKICLVTGGAGGIGLEICKALLDAKSKVILADIDENKSKDVLNKFSKKLSISVYKLAEGILSIINTKMADAIRTITVKHGIDPREFSLVAFGGAGPMHAAWIAKELEINEIIIPDSPGTVSGWGMLQTDIRKDLTKNPKIPCPCQKI